MAKSKFFRVAVEGATATDGREITRQWIDEMAAGYNRETYGARVNMEHIRGFSDKPPFNAYGDVLAVKAEDVELTINGKVEKRRALFAQIDPTDDLVKVTKARQKIYTSIEVAPNFAGTGKAGLVGLAVTDSPASLGTEILQFSAKANDSAAAAVKASFDARKQNPENAFSAAEETSIEFDAEPAAGGASALDTVVAAFAKVLGLNAGGAAAQGHNLADVTGALSAKPAAQAAPADFTAFALGVQNSITELARAIDKHRAEDQGRLQQLSTDLAAMKARVDKFDSQETGGGRRPAATGAGQHQLADF